MDSHNFSTEKRIVHRHKPRLALMGAGRWGTVLIRRLFAHNGCGSLLVCDTDRCRLNAIKSEFPGISVTCSVDDILSDPDIDAGIIATPIETHGSLAEQLLIQKKHVLVEKPLAILGSTATQLVELAERQQRVLMVAHTPLFSPVARRVHLLITEQQASTSLFFHMRRINIAKDDPQTPGSLLWDLAVHDLALFMAWTGLKAARIRIESTMWQAHPPQLILILRSELHRVELVVGNDFGRERLIRFEAGSRVVEWRDDEAINLKVTDHGLSERYSLRAEEPLICQFDEFLGAVQNERAVQTSDGRLGAEVVILAERIERRMKA